MQNWRNMKNPKVSIIVPVYLMTDAIFFLKRNLESILNQTYTDYEIIISDDSEDDMLKSHFRTYPVKWFKNTGKHSMADNTNSGISHASGDLIKILFQDDFFYNNTAQEEIVSYFKKDVKWLVTGCTHTIGNVHMPFWSESDNTIGSPSVLTIHKSVTERFDPDFHWVLDLDLYKRLYRKYGKPKLLNKINVVIGIGPHQTTHNLSEERKLIEHEMLKAKYEKN